MPDVGLFFGKLFCTIALIIQHVHIQFDLLENYYYNIHVFEEKAARKECKYIL